MEFRAANIVISFTLVVVVSESDSEGSGEVKGKMVQRRSRSYCLSSHGRSRRLVGIVFRSTEFVHMPLWYRLVQILRMTRRRMVMRDLLRDMTCQGEPSQ